MIQIPIGRFRVRQRLAGLRERASSILLSGLSLLAGCRQAEPAPGALATVVPSPVPVQSSKNQADLSDAGSAPARELSWRFAEGPFGPTEVVISVPPLASPSVRFPVLVAFHGREQTIRDSKRGARAWLDDYRLGRARERLSQPPLAAGDFESLVTEERLTLLDQELRRQPYADLIVVCPFLPDVLAEPDAVREGQALADFVVDRILPRVRARTPALAEPAATGVDGISLGGRAALLVGLSRPLAFGSVGALQAALGAGEVERFAELGAAAVRQNPALKLRLVTSDEDAFAAPNRALSAALSSRGARHTLLLARGAHGPDFTRGPGALEMLLFHSRVLRGLEAL
jgi:enterochelin esterase-like enzyme